MNCLFFDAMEVAKGIQLKLRDLFTKDYRLIPPDGPDTLALLDEDEIANEGLYKDKYEVLKQEFDVLRKRYNHLLESDFITSFDAWNPRTNNYNRDISEADKIVDNIEELYERAKGV